MSYDCYCDYEAPSICHEATPIARKNHRCTECGRAILKGDRYEYTWGIWGGDAQEFKTCQRCIALRDFVKAHVPCLCDVLGGLIEECMETARGYAHEAPGLLFGAYRRQVLIRRGPRVTP